MLFIFNPFRGAQVNLLVGRAYLLHVLISTFGVIKTLKWVILQNDLYSTKLERDEIKDRSQRFIRGEGCKTKALVLILFVLTAGGSQPESEPFT